MKHTPGPWIVPDDGTIGTVADSQGRVVAQAQQVTSADRHTDHAERRANAQLIAAAPELLEACKKTITWLAFNAGRMEADPNHHPQALKNIKEDLDVVIAAIQKAEGVK